jgi:rhodanese-related sulfurtransferase
MKKVASIAMMMFFLTPCLFTISYADDVTTVEAYNMVCDNTNVYIVDVRTDAEWIWVGHPGPNNTGEGDCLDGKVVNIPVWLGRPGNWSVNKSFIEDVNEFFEDIEDPVLITMCLSGGRSKYAQGFLKEEGYVDVYNMLTGFQGSVDEYGYRNVNGWVVVGHPYNYDPIGVYPD